MTGTAPVKLRGGGGMPLEAPAGVPVVDRVASLYDQATGVRMLYEMQLLLWVLLLLMLLLLLMSLLLIML